MASNTQNNERIKQLSWFCNQALERHELHKSGNYFFLRSDVVEVFFCAPIVYNFYSWSNANLVEKIKKKIMWISLTTGFVNDTVLYLFCLLAPMDYVRYMNLRIQVLE